MKQWRKQAPDSRRLPKAFAEFLKLLLEPLGQTTPEKRKVLLDVGDLGLPCLEVHIHERLHVLRRDPESREIQVPVLRHQADRRLLGADLPFHPLADPFEHAAVVAEAWPQESAFRA